MTFEILARQNPWWTEAGSIEEDPYIRAFDEAPLHWDPPFFHTLNLREDSVYILLGPRQVGKTTFFKLLLRKLLSDEGVHPRRLLYLNCEEIGSQTPQELAEGIESYVGWARPRFSDRLYVLLDEATYVRDWERGIKIVADRGSLRGITLMATGSHAAGLRRGAERLPGRRGRGKSLDILLLPLSFREFIAAKNPDVAQKLPAFSKWDLDALFGAAREVSLHREVLIPLFETYLSTGGFPRSVLDEASTGVVKPDTYKLYRDALVGDLTRLGRRESLFRELAQWIINHRENPFEWSSPAKETYVGTHPTVREYVEDAEAAFVWDVFYKVKNIGQPLRAPRSPKKVYFKDPFGFHTIRTWVFGYAHPWKASREFLSDPTNVGYMVESIAASHLRRCFGDAIFYWRNGGEIDFVVFREGSREILIEVKYQRRIVPENTKALVKWGGGVLLTRNLLSFDAQRNLLALPLPYLLALLTSSETT